MLRARVGCAAVALVLALLAVAIHSPGSACQGQPVLTREFEIGDRERVSERIPVPPGRHLLIQATEQNVDVLLQLPVVQRVTDSPVARRGPQRIFSSSGPAKSLEIELIRAEHSATRGRVRVDIISYDDTQYSGGCVTTERRLASGDERYAQTKLVYLGLKKADADVVRQHFDAAIDDYRVAARSASAQELPALVAHARLSLSDAVYHALTAGHQGADRTWTIASDEAARAELAFRQVNDEYGLALARAARATADMERALSTPPDTGNRESLLSEARATLEEVAALHERRNEPFDRALALNNIGLAFYYENRFGKAIRSYRRAQPIYAHLQERAREAQVLQNIALVQYELGRLSEALADYDRALASLTEKDDPKAFAVVLNNRALAKYGSRDLDGALRDYNAALDTFTRIASVRDQSRSLFGIGAVYYASGDLERARYYFGRALEMRPAQSDPRGRIVTLRASANVLSALGRNKEALQLRNEAIALAAPMKPIRARVRVQAARDLAALARTDEALQMVELALTEADSRDRMARSQALVERGRLRLRAGRLDEAWADAADALKLLETYKSPVDELDALMLSARIAQARADLPEASKMVDRALGLAEQVRLQSANPELRAGLWDSVRPAFDLKIDLLALADGFARARQNGESVTLATARAMLDTAEQSRGRALSDYERLVGQNTTPARQEAELRRNELYREIAARRFRLDGYLDRGLGSNPHVALIQAEIAAFERKIDLLNARISGAPAKSRSTRAGLSGVAESVMHSLPADAAVIEFWLGDRRARAWSITREGVQHFELGDTRQIDAAAVALYAAMNGATAVTSEERSRRLREMYRLVIEPLRHIVRTHRILTFVPDGKLHYVPFAALATGDHSRPEYLIDDHDVAIAPSLAVLGIPPQQRAEAFPREMLLVADPVYSADDPRVASSVKPASTAAPAPSRGVFHFRARPVERLPGAALEIDAIGKLIGSDRLTVLSGSTASRAAFLAQDFTKYRFIHIAAHGIGNARSPKFSELLLSAVDAKGSPIAGGVFAGDLALRPIDAEVVVFSACETAIGPEAAGEGLLGLRYAAHAGGARSVVASLWKAADLVAVQIMSEFYTNMMQTGKTPRAALARAMRSARSRYGDPLLWGAFDLSIARREASL
jgi:CHAT domain-containing protein